jgi:hypothetical protein
MAPRSESEKVRPKRSYFSSACEYVKLPFSLKVPKKKFYELTVVIISIEQKFDTLHST